MVYWIAEEGETDEDYCDIIRITQEGIYVRNVDPSSELKQMEGIRNVLSVEELSNKKTCHSQGRH